MDREPSLAVSVYASSFMSANRIGCLHRRLRSIDFEMPEAYFDRPTQRVAPLLRAPPTTVRRSGLVCVHEHGNSHGPQRDWSASSARETAEASGLLTGPGKHKGSNDFSRTDGRKARRPMETRPRLGCRKKIRRTDDERRVTSRRVDE